MRKVSISILKELLVAEDFFKLYSRNSSLQIAENFTYHCMKPLKEWFNIEFTQFTLNQENFASVYCWQNEFNAVYKAIEERYTTAASMKDFYEDVALPVFSEYEKVCLKIAETYTNRSYSNEQILQDYKIFTNINARFIALNFFIYLSDSVLGSMLNEYFPDDVELLSRPIQKTAVTNEHEALLKIAMLDPISDAYKEALQQHVERYSWFPCYNPCDNPYTIEHYQKELAAYTPTTGQAELEEIQQEQKEHATKLTAFIENITDQDLKKLVTITNSVSYYREYRNDIRRQGLARVRGLYEAIGTQFGLSVQEACYMTNQEIYISLEDGILCAPIEQIKSRISGYALYTTLDTYVVIDAQEEVEALATHIAVQSQQRTFVTGITACHGVAHGPVRIVMNIASLHHFQEGDIMVVSMTGPEYVPAMKKCAAIVTDEGGITCHAAVIAREFGIPCIVGTKNATTVFKNGDVVAVDTETGVVAKQ